jgi:hypothetical protein
VIAGHLIEPYLAFGLDPDRSEQRLRAPPKASSSNEMFLEDGGEQIEPNEVHAVAEIDAPRARDPDQLLRLGRVGPGVLAVISWIVETWLNGCVLVTRAGSCHPNRSRP